MNKPFCFECRLFVGQVKVRYLRIPHPQSRWIIIWPDFSSWQIAAFHFCLLSVCFQYLVISLRLGKILFPLQFTRNLLLLLFFSAVKPKWCFTLMESIFTQDGPVFALKTALILRHFKQGARNILQRFIPHFVTIVANFSSAHPWCSPQSALLDWPKGVFESGEFIVAFKKAFDCF